MNTQRSNLEERRWSFCSEDLLGAGRGNAMGEWEFEVLLDELLDVWTADICSLLDLYNLQDLFSSQKCLQWAIELHT
jgi:hypothetical protein